jgi:ferredoxin
VLSLGDSGLQASQVERCDGCARCEEICPEGALEVEFTIIWDNQSPAPPADAVPTAGGAS